MKKELFTMMLMLLSMAAVVVSGCSSDDDETITRYSDDNISLIPIEEGEVFAAVSDFFRITSGSDEIKQEAFDFKNDLCHDGKNSCLLINNGEEFKEAYMGDSPLPSIDFSKYSLIVGRVYISAGTFIDNMSIRQINNSKSILAINYCVDTKGCYIGILHYEYYWSLFPKFHASEIEIVVEETGE